MELGVYKSDRTKLKGLKGYLTPFGTQGASNLELVTRVSKFAHLSHDSFGKWASFQDEFVCYDELTRNFPQQKDDSKLLRRQFFWGGGGFNGPNQKKSQHNLRGPRSLSDT